MTSKTKTWAAIGLVAIVLALLGYQLKGMFALNHADDTPASTATVALHDPTPPDLDAAAARSLTYSNIYKYDYVGPETCAKCHARNYEMWRGHPHSKMNRNATAQAVVSDFSGSSLEYGDGRVVFSKVQGEYTMNLYRGEKFVRQLKVTRVIGSRFVQMFVGVQSEGPEPREDPIYTHEEKLPFAYWIERKEWFPQTYDETKPQAEWENVATGALTRAYGFLDKPSGRSEWQQICIKCHNTYPYAVRFEAAVEGKLLGFPTGDVKHKTAKETNRPLEPFELVTLGISCESCHFGGREHALEGASISFVPRSPDLDFPKATPELIANGRREPYVVDSICRQCHTADPQGPIYPNGAASWNSREARDMSVGSCASKIACTNCHNPHEAGPTTGAVPDRESHIAACIGCHQKYREPATATAHSGHPAAAKVNCLDCHMPKIVHGLSGTIRSHRISSPTDPKMLQDEYPNACNLCHLDKSTKWTLDQLAIASKWNKKIDLPESSSARASAGGGGAAFDAPLGPRWLSHKEPVVRQVAASAYARSPLGKEALPLVAKILNDDSPPARMFGALAVEKILGRPVPVSDYTPWAKPSVREQQIKALLLAK